MPIPQLSSKTKSPKDWRQNRTVAKRRLQNNSKYTGSGNSGGSSKKESRGPFKTVLIIFVALVAIGGISSIALLGWIAKDLPNPDKIIDRTVAESTKIYDRTGENLLFDIHGEEQRTVVDLKEIPQYVIDATLTAEDRNFYEHSGISLTGIIRSIFINITTGSRVGGSTLTQQLVKNAVLSSEKTYTRKLKELILSYQIEKKFEKDQILQLYFNEIPYGSVAYGAEAGAQTYFGKSIREIGLAEAAVLSALPQAPSKYSPYGTNVDGLYDRQHWILDNMAELGYITKEDAEHAKKEEIKFKERINNITAPHFVMFVRDYLTTQYGELAVEQGGLKVITTLDLEKQTIAEEAIEEITENNLTAWNASNAALVAIDPKTGQILTMVGSRDYFDNEIDGQVNIATRNRQPGSSFKPMVYTAGLQKGYTPDTVLYDVNTKFLNYDLKDYEPKNYDLNQHGAVTMRKALAGSLNIPAVKMIYLTGVDKVIDLTQGLGYTTLDNRSRFGLSLVLGGGEVKLLEHVNAYAALAQEGEWHPTSSILEVRDKDGKLLEEFKQREKKVLETQVARQINNMLSDNEARTYVFGPNSPLQLGERPVAAKTGTTNDYRDAWTVGFTPSLAVGVWVGNNDNSAMRRGAAGGVVAAPIWNKFMSNALSGTPIENFKEPKKVESDKPSLNGSIAGGIKVKIDKNTGKLATSLTPESSVEEKTFQEAHSILHYINKDDPQGSSAPDHSSEQYKRWEEAIHVWAKENDITIESPPTEIDDVHTIANRPNIQINSPSRNQNITTRELSVSVSASAPRGVNRVEYYVNNNKVGTATRAPFNLTVQIADPSISTGGYVLKAVAYDDVNNSRSDEINLNFDLPEAPPSLTWFSPSENQLLSVSDFPLSLSATLNSPDTIGAVNLFYENQDGHRDYINTVRQFPGGGFNVQWFTKPTEGSYTVIAEVTNKNNATFIGGEIDVIVQ